MGRGLSGVEQGAARAEIHFHGTVQALVERGLGLGPHQQPGIDPGQGVGAVGIGEKIQLRGRIQANFKSVARHFQPRLQGLGAAAVARILRADARVINAIRQGADAGTHVRFGGVQEPLHAGLNHFFAVAFQQVQKPLLPQSDGPQLGVHVASLIFARPEVGQDHVQDVAAHFSLVN